MSRDDDAEAYRFLADHVIDELNPPDSDGAEESILADAITHAVAFIVTQPCTCRPEVTDPEIFDSPCDRCQALGRRADVREER